MSTTKTVYFNRFAAIDAERPTWNDHTSGQIQCGMKYISMSPITETTIDVHFGFPDLSTELEAIKHKKLVGGTVNFYGSGYSMRPPHAPTDAWLYAYGGDDAWDETTITYNDDTGAYLSLVESYFKFGPSAGWGVGAISVSSVRRLLLSYVDVRLTTTNTIYAIINTPKAGSNRPYFSYTYDDDNVDLKFASFSPANGATVNRFLPLSVSFQLKQNGVALENIGIASYTVQWTGSKPIHVQLEGAPLYAAYTLPANSMPSGDVVIKVTVTDTAGGTVSMSSTVDTTDTVSSAVALFPKNTYVDGSSPCTFSWQHINASGSAQTGAVLQIWAEDDDPQTYAEIAGAANSYTVPAGSFPSGTYKWRIATRNADGVQGSWSETEKFLVISAPSKPIVLITDNSPRPEIQWQTNEQEGYQVQLEGIYDQILFGPGKTWKCPQYLDDGAYTVRVRAQNRYGLWSPWGEAAIVISNTAGPTIQLSVQFGHIAALSWTGQGYDFYLVYRDGKPIARLTDTEYIDEYSGGQVAYFIRGGYTGSGNYGSSNVVDGSISVDMTMIKAIPDGQWIQLPYSTSMYANDSTTRRRDASRQKLQGRAYPVAELGEFLERSTSFSCAFFHQDDPGLQQLLGRTVCAKAPGQEVIIGTLDSLRSTHSTFYVSYAFDLSQEYFEEEIDIDTGNILSS